MIDSQILIKWDYDSLESSLRRGYTRDYNFYMIFLDRKDDYWRKLDPNGSTELYYIGSTRMNSTSSRLLNNHDGLEMALKEGFGDIHVALGYWDVDSDLSIKQANDYVLSIESALIYNFMPTKNKVNRMKYSGPEIVIRNDLHSYGGLLINELVINQEVLPLDNIAFSKLSRSYIEYYFKQSPDIFQDGIIQLLGRLELDLSPLNEEIIVT